MQGSMHPACGAKKHTLDRLDRSIWYEKFSDAGIDRTRSCMLLNRSISSDQMRGGKRRRGRLRYFSFFTSFSGMENFSETELATPGPRPNL